MKNITVHVFAMLTVLLGAPWVGLAEDTSPGKNSVYASDSSTAGLPGSCGNELLAGIIEKGKPKRVIAIEATLNTALSSNLDDLCLKAEVNGVQAQPFSSPTFFGTRASCNAGETCSLAASFWLDLDAAEAANPGVFKKQPLNIRLLGGDDLNNGSGAFYAVTMTARMEKK